ncbi:tyrosine-type recombinase/integrase [Ornithinicoccus hortensis]|uniref:Site-specific recombinase XerD n=1 Tax=Ornithinicoccus hortensis TaxID=82346 RepID=A0A542YR55_9MICO|nr:site-specific integrase [Ornithinicoccus hortensis]TQL50572.1 site-specific recombinase XerD [Ornithinicoccus hortensis]
MASLTTTKANDGSPRYVVNYRDLDNRQRRKSFRRKGEAERFRNTVEADKLRGTYIDVDAGRVTFSEYAAEWLAGRTFEETTYEATELRLRLHVLPILGQMQLRQIKPSTIQRLIASMDLSDTYKRMILSNVSAIFGAAVDDDLIAKNPCKAGSVARPKVVRRKVVPWPAEWVSAMHDALPERYQIAVTLGSGLGLRQGEVFGLSPDDVDFLRGTVEVRRQVKILAGNKLVFSLPKGRKTRTVPLPKTVADELSSYLARFRAMPVELPWRTLNSGESVRVPLVLTTRERRPLNRNYFNGNLWRRAQATAGVVPTRENGMHALRHWYASVLLDAGESIRAVSEYLGHSDPGFTLRTYTHLMPSSDERTRTAVDSALTDHKEAGARAPAACNAP